VSGDDVLVVIGGARGITAEVAKELALRHHPTLVLVGRSPWPAEEPEWADGHNGKALRKDLFEKARARGERPTPRELEREAQRITRNQEMRRSRREMEAAGSAVFYYQADARDAGSMKALIERIYRDHGKIDGVIFGAGIIDDKLIRDKSPTSFDAVFDTKSSAIFHLAQHLRPESLKFLVIFSSIAGWVGNPGQVDYVAGNEVLNRMAMYLRRRWNKRVVAIDWGPWENSNMVTEEVRDQFLRRHVAIVPPDMGRRFLLDEIHYGSPADSLVAALGSVDAVDAGSG